MESRKVGVVGAGVMGVGIAQDLAQAGHAVVCIDICDRALQQARERLRQNLRLKRLISSAGDVAPEDVHGRVTFGSDPSLLANADFVVEAVPEKWEIKAEVFRLLDRTCRQDCVFASNTSAISITRLAAVTARPALIIGIHFMNPSPLRPVVELIAGAETDDGTIFTVRQWLAAMGKECILIKDSPGFISNRILMMMINEAARLVQEQVATGEQVDRVFRECLGHKMGPLETADLIGLDVIHDTLGVLQESFAEDRYLPCALLEELRDSGRLGRKSGAGFFEYE